MEAPPPVLAAGPVAATATPATIPASTQEQQQTPAVPTTRSGDGSHQVLSPTAPAPLPPGRVRKRARRKPTETQDGDDIVDVPERFPDELSPIMDANAGPSPMVAVGAPRMWKVASSFLVPAPRSFGPKPKRGPPLLLPIGADSPPPPRPCTYRTPTALKHPQSPPNHPNHPQPQPHCIRCPRTINPTPSLCVLLSAQARRWAAPSATAPILDTFRPLPIPCRAPAHRRHPARGTRRPARVRRMSAASRAVRWQRWRRLAAASPPPPQAPTSPSR